MDNEEKKNEQEQVEEEVLEKEDVKEETEVQGDSATQDIKEEKTTVKQSREENSSYARMRRENERLKKENELYKAKVQQGIEGSVLDDLGLTREDLDDEENLALAQKYIEGVSKGVTNPSTYAYKELKREAKAKEQEALKAKEEEEKKAKEEQDLILKDGANFKKKYSQQELEEAMDAKSEFARYFGPLLKAGNLTQLYDIYKSIKGQETVSDKAKEMAIPPTLGSGKLEVKSKSVKDMTDEEYIQWLKERGKDDPRLS